MQNGNFRRFVVVSVLGVACTVLNTGCIDKIGQAFINGFGFSFGAVPANIISDYILTNFLGGLQ